MKRDFYQISETKRPPEMNGFWDGDTWRNVSPLSIDCYRPEGSPHRPVTRCKLLYSEQSLHAIFQVEDRFVRCIHTEFQDDVWKDSCVELFIQPQHAAGYFNFEFNCGGALLASYVTDSARKDGRLQAFTKLTPEDDLQIRRYASLPPVVKPEMAAPCIWYLECAIPWKVLERYAGAAGVIKGQAWRANFYKCGNETSHPHWVSWQPLRLRNFHDPECFGTVIFV